MKSRKLLRYTLSIFALVSCLPIVVLSSPPPSGGGANQEYETRVYLRRQCLISEANKKDEREFFGLGAVFLPLIFKKIFGGVGSALKKAGAVQVLKDDGRFPTYLYELRNKTVVRNGAIESNTQQLGRNPNLGCVIVVRGAFNGIDPVDQTRLDFSAGVGVLIGDDDGGSRISRLNKSNIPVREIAMLFEAAIRVSDDNSAIYYENKFLEVRSFQGSRNSDSRGLVISVGISAPGKDNNDGGISLALLSLGEVKKGVYGPVALASRKSRWFGGIGISKEALEQVESIKAPTNGAIGIMPVTFESVIIETDDGNKALTFIGELLDDAKDDAAKAISGEILKDREKEKNDAIELLRGEEEQKYSDFLSSLVDLESAGVAFPIPAGAFTYAQEVKIAKTSAALRSWCSKSGALKTMGVSVSRRFSSSCS